MSLKILAPCLLLLGLGVGFLIGRSTGGGPTVEYVQGLEADNERLIERVASLCEDDTPQLGGGEPLDPSERAIARLRKGGLSHDETLALLEVITADQARTLNLEALLGPILETDGYKVVKVLGRLEPSPSVLAALDKHVIRGAATGSTTQAVLSHYLRYTGRFQWTEARPVIESGLEQSSKATRGVFLLTAMDLEQGPDDDWVTWAQRHYAFSDAVRLVLRKRLQK